MGMPIGYLAHTLSRDAPASMTRASKVVVKRDLDILDGPYPKRFADFVGQQRARAQITAAIISAQERDARMDHMLLASGLPGIGKTALSRLTAYSLGVGFVELGGAVTDKDAAAALKEMQDRDVLFLDEIHRLVSGGKARAEWLLTLLQDGTLHTPSGTVQAPDITVIAATTDAQKLPETILDRFKIKPKLDYYTGNEAAEIARLTATRLGFGTHLPMPGTTDWLAAVARACDNNPRRIDTLLGTVRDIAISSRDEAGTPGNLSEEGYSLDLALDWEGVTFDGLTMVMQDYLAALHHYDGVAGAATLKAALNESDLTLTEKALIQRGYIIVAPKGRVLTESGAERAEQLAFTQLATARAREAQ